MNLQRWMIVSNLRGRGGGRITAHERLRVALVGLGTSVVPLDSAVNIAFPDITASFDLPLQMIQWVVICYVLTHASLMLACGRVGDVFGHARIFRAGLLWNSMAFLCCAAAPTFGWLLFCRFLQGIGAALILSCAPALVAGPFPEGRRSQALAVFTAMHALGSAAGPLLGGMLVDLWGWPAVFWVRTPIALAAFAFLGRLPAVPQPGTREPVDVVGAALLALAISATLLFLNQLQPVERHPLLLIVILAISFAATCGFILRERNAVHPIINLGFFRTTRFAAINGASFLVQLTGFSVLLFVPYYLVRFTGLPLPLAGAVLAASFGGSIAASAVARSLTERLPAGYTAAFGAALSGSGLCLVGSWDAAASWVEMVATLTLQGFGAGLFQVDYLSLVMATLAARHRGVAGSLAMLTRTLGVVTGAALLTLVFHILELGALGGGMAPADGFMSAFRSVFRLAGAVGVSAAAIVALSFARPRSS